MRDYMREYMRRRRAAAKASRASIWEGGRAKISVLDKHFAEALAKNSSHCALAFAVRDAVPHARHISVDLQTIRWTDTERGVRYCFLTPAIAQQDVIIPFDQGERDKLKPVTFSMKPAFVTRTGKKRTHTPDNDQLKDAKLKVAEEQPHLPVVSGRDNGAAPVEGPPEAVGNPPVRPLVPYAGKEPPKKRGPYKPRQPRAMISATKPDGTIPTTLGGKLPPVSVLARREFGLRAVRR
jgi:hypothetical protein